MAHGSWDTLRTCLFRVRLVVEGRLFPARARVRNQRRWEAAWSQDKYAPPWSDRGIAPEIVEAVRTGWLPPKGSVLDIGCGLGEIAAWFAERGYKSVAFDISESAVRKGRELHKHLPSPPEYLALDINAAQPPDLQYDILVDRGCFHQISPVEIPNCVRNLAAVCAPDARLLLFVAAFRNGIAFGDPAERRRKVKWVENAFAGVFNIEKTAETYLDRDHGRNPSNVLPGLVFWMRRIPHGARS